MAHNSYYKYTLYPPLRREPAYLRQAVHLARSTGGIASATTVLFRRANITVHVVGDVSGWNQASAGTLLIGDHRDRFEVGPLLAVLGGFPREDIHFIQKPFSKNARLFRSLGSRGEDIPLPVIPQTLAGDRSNVFNRDLWWRMLLRGGLPTAADLRALNMESLDRAARAVSDGRLVSLYPAGGCMDAAKKPWQRGIGRIIKLLSHEARERVQVVLFRFDDFSTLKISRSLRQQERGIRSEPYAVTLRLGAQGSVYDLLGEEAPIDYLSAEEITVRLRQRFVEPFRSTAPVV
ncbi:hypothetical protein [Streptomyces sp. NBC_01235]|uniref:hypothetical protein n=1 Tax=Streptomyces sp. NBC_01235 TaxID=2903788 RepID=UPI002E13B521|nr:hypothetical protein OG289_08125 [Streptomyces sp. NBC_01235]